MVNEARPVPDPLRADHRDHRIIRRAGHTEVEPVDWVGSIVPREDLPDVFGQGGVLGDPLEGADARAAVVVAVVAEFDEWVPDERVCGEAAGAWRVGGAAYAGFEGRGADEGWVFGVRAVEGPVWWAGVTFEGGFAVDGGGDVDLWLAFESGPADISEFIAHDPSVWGISSWFQRSVSGEVEGWGEEAVETDQLGPPL